MAMQAYTNGNAHHHQVVVRAVPAPRPDPFVRVLGIGMDMTGVIVFCVIGALIVHAGFGVRTMLIDPWLLQWANRTGMQIESRLQASIDVTTEKEAPPPPPQEDQKEEEQPKEVVTKKVEENPYDKVDTTPKNNPPPDSAQAGAILHSDDALDFTGDGFVTSNNSTYAGGRTSNNGTKKREEKVGGAGGGGSGTDQQKGPPAQDLSRGISLAGSKEWSCPNWPAEADAQQVDEWKVTIEVTVGPDGRAQTVSVLKDGDYGFGAAAKACAMKQTYNSALDREGHPIVAKKQWRVLFER